MKIFQVLTLTTAMALTILTAVNGIPTPNTLFRRTFSKTETHMLTPAQLVAIRYESESAESVAGTKAPRSALHSTPRSDFVPGLDRSASAAIPAGILGVGVVEAMGLESHRSKNLWGLMKRDAEIPQCFSGPFGPLCTGPISSASSLADVNLELIGIKGLGLLGTVSLIGVVIAAAV